MAEEVPQVNPDEMMQGAADAARGIVEDNKPLKTQEEIADQVGRITDKLVERAGNVAPEHRKDGPNYGSPGLLVSGNSLEGGNMASSDFTRITNQPGHTKVEKFTDAGGLGVSQKINSTTTKVYPHRVFGTAVDHTGIDGSPRFRDTNPGENIKNLANGLSRVRGEIAKAENRQKSAEDKAA